MLLEALAACAGVTLRAVATALALPVEGAVHAEGDKVRDADGNHMSGIRVSFDVAFPDGPEGDAARGRVQAAIEMSRDRLCTVSRTVQLGARVSF